MQVDHPRAQGCVLVRGIGLAVADASARWHVLTWLENLREVDAAHPGGLEANPQALRTGCSRGRVDGEGRPGPGTIVETVRADPYSFRADCPAIFQRY